MSKFKIGDIIRHIDVITSRYSITNQKGLYKVIPEDLGDDPLGDVRDIRIEVIDHQDLDQDGNKRWIGNKYHVFPRYFVLVKKAKQLKGWVIK